MADVIRGPLLVNERQRAPLHRLSQFVFPSLLVTTLGVVSGVPLPASAAHVQPAQVHVRPGLFPNADTSHGSPKTLLADKQLPVFVLPALWQGQHGKLEWLNPDTSRGTPKALFADKQLPFEPAPQFAPVAKPSPVVDTSIDTPLALLTVVLPPPLVVAPNYPPPRLLWLPADTSRGVPKGLIPDAQAPVFVPPHLAPNAKQAPTPDTSQDTPLGLLAALAPPFVPAPHYPPPRLMWLPADTTLGTPKWVRPDAQLPFPAMQQTAPDRVRPAVDTTLGTPPPLVTVLIPPTVVAPHFGPSSRPLNGWLPADATRATPKALLADAQLPFAILQPPVLDRLRPVVDTSQSALAAQLAPNIGALPPGMATPPGLQKFQWQPPDGSAGVPKTLREEPEPPPVVITPPPAPPSAGGGGTGKHKRDTRTQRSGKTRHVSVDRRDDESYQIPEHLRLTPKKQAPEPSTTPRKALKDAAGAAKAVAPAAEDVPMTRADFEKLMQRLDVIEHNMKAMMALIASL